jgi:hypothetical protein
MSEWQPSNQPGRYDKARLAQIAPVQAAIQALGLPPLRQRKLNGVLNALYASPLYPRLLDANTIRETIAKGVANGFLAYLGKLGDGSYRPFYYRESLGPADIEIAEDMFIITRETAEAYLQQQEQIQSTPDTAVENETAVREPSPTLVTGTTLVEGTAVPPEADTTPPSEPDSDGQETPVSPGITQLTWRGDIPAQKWVNFYMKVLAKFASNHDLKLTLQVEISGDSAISKQKIEEMKAALRELGLDDRII